jgi:hypothetical protein
MPQIVRLLYLDTLVIRMPKEHPIVNAMQAVRYHKVRSPPWCRRQLRQNHTAVHSSGPLSGVRILDLTRVLAVRLAMQKEKKKPLT